MKRISSLIFVAALVLSLCACAGGESAEKSGLYVGYSRKDITPNYQVHLAGGDWKSRTSTGFIDPITITCIAFTEGDQTLLMFTMDFLGSNQIFVDAAVEQISGQTGVPKENIWMNATHTHSSVAIYTDWDKVPQYRDTFNKAAVKAATDAIADQAKAEAYYGGVDAPGMAYVRHYKMADGTVAGANFGSFSTDIVSHTIEADTELQLVRFVREGENKKDVLMMSFPAHCTLNQNSSQLSADYPGPARMAIESQGDYLVAFFQGASGDQVPSSRIPGEQFSADYKVYGQELARIALEALPGLKKMESTKLNVVYENYVGEANKEGIERLNEARSVQAVIDQYGKSSAEAKAACAQYGFSSVYESTAVITRANSEETRNMLLRAFSVGEVGYVVASYEMFCKHATFIKENSPFELTMIMTLGYGNDGYLPTLEAFEYHSYEACVSNYARGTGETLAQKYVDLLTGLSSK